jgi:hypothetical protein
VVAPHWISVKDVVQCAAKNETGARTGMGRHIVVLRGKWMIQKPCIPWEMVTSKNLHFVGNGYAKTWFSAIQK